MTFEMASFCVNRRQSGILLQQVWSLTVANILSPKPIKYIIINVSKVRILSPNAVQTCVVFTTSMYHDHTTTKKRHNIVYTAGL